MAASRRVAAPLGRHRRTAATSVCLLLCSWSASTLSSPSHVALALSHAPPAVGRSRALATSSASFEHRGPRAERSRAFRRRGDRAFAPDAPTPTVSLALRSGSRPRCDVDLAALPSDSAEGDGTEEAGAATAESSTLKTDARNVAMLAGAQFLLIPISVLLAKALHVPNDGLGEGFRWTARAAAQGLRGTLPLFGVAGALRLIEPRFSALQEVTKATQRTVMAVFGRRRRPLFALSVSLLMGAMAGWGEEWLFRGVFQTALGEVLSGNAAIAVSGLVFGLLHAITPVYALLAAVASVYFGYLYNATHNLAVSMICHAAYDVVALMWAHWTVTGMSPGEQEEIWASGPGAPRKETATRD